MNPIEPNKIDQIISKYTDYDGALIQILLDVQQEYNWVPSEAADLISDKMDVPITQIYRVASFYKSLSLRPRGKHLINLPGVLL